MTSVYFLIQRDKYSHFKRNKTGYGMITEKAREVSSTQESNLFPFIFRNKDNIALQESKNGSKVP